MKKETKFKTVSLKEWKDFRKSHDLIPSEHVTFWSYAIEWLDFSTGEFLAYELYRPIEEKHTFLVKV